MTENRHIRRRIGWERRHPGVAARIRFPQLLVVFLGVLSLALQSFVVQTHVHAPQAFAAKSASFIALIAGSSGVSDISLGHTHSPGGQYPANRDTAPCPWCKELTHSGQYVPSASVLTTLPYPVTLNVIVFKEIAPSLFAASHTWRGRAPPLV